MSGSSAVGPRTDGKSRKSLPAVKDFADMPNPPEREEETYLRASEARKRQVQHLFSCYFIQIRHGCGDSTCTTPTCFSCLQRQKGVPVRRPTPLTARTQAFFLAGEGSSESRLCPNIIKLQESSDADQSGSPFGHGAWHPQTRRDRKSLSQNVFDTMAIKLFQASPNADLLQPMSRAEAAKLELSKPMRKPSTRTLSVDGIASNSSRELAASGKIAISAVKEPLIASTPENPTASKQDPPVTRFLGGKKPNPDGLEKLALRPGSQKGSKPHPLAIVPPVTAKQSLPPRKTADAVPALKSSDHEASKKSASPSSQLPPPAYLDSELLNRLHEYATVLSGNYSKEGTTATIEQFNHLDNPATISHLSWNDAIFVRESIFEPLGCTDNLIASFRESDFEKLNSPLPHLNSIALEKSFRCWRPFVGSMVFDSLWLSLEALCTPPPGLNLWKKRRGSLLSPRTPSALGDGGMGGGGSNSKWRRASQDLHPLPAASPKDSSDSRPAPLYVSDEDAAHIIMICIHAVTADLCHIMQSILARSHDGELIETPAPMKLRDVIAVSDQLGDEPAQRLVARLLKVVGIRRCHWSIQQATMRAPTDSGAAVFPLMNILLKHLIAINNFRWPVTRTADQPLRDTGTMQVSTAATFLLRLQQLVISDWDGKVEIKRWSHVGSAIETMADFRECQSELGLKDETFQIRFVDSQLDPIVTPVQYLARIPSPNIIHLLSYPFLFSPISVIKWFRVINYNTMARTYENSGYLSYLMGRMPFNLGLTHGNYLTWRLKSSMCRFLTLNIRRSSVLEDSFNQLWQRERRELLRPVKIMMGAEEGEEGVDLGGVSIEYFRLAVAEAMNPALGMFTVDPRTHMCWFQPGSLEPLYRFELLGIIVSLALYNGLTLPMTFPEALYRKLLGFPVNSVEHIRDGWPDLAKGFDQLLDWSDGRVEDVFMRTYDFSFEAFGNVVQVDMNAYDRKSTWPATDASPTDNSSFSENPRLPPFNSESWSRPPPSLDEMIATRTSEFVTNENRQQYVSDYIYWLTDKSISPQFAAFTRGFHTCLDRGSISLFAPSTLRNLVEGYQEIDIDALQQVTVYEDGFSADHELIKGFWDIVKGFDQEHRRRLLEFVTASDRVPVTGISSIVFCIVRIGTDSSRIPSAMTCFGKLLLPAYDNVEMLREKLMISLRHSRGFGSL